MSRPVRAASPNIRIRDRVDWVPNRAVDIVTSIQRSSIDHRHVLDSTVPRPVNSPTKTPAWHDVEGSEFIAPPDGTLSNRPRSVCYADLQGHPHVALPAPYEVLPAHDRSYDIDHCISAGTPALHAIVEKRAAQHSRKVGPTRRRGRRAEGARSMMGPGFYGITEAPSHPRPRSAALSEAPRFPGPGHAAAPDATYDSSTVPWIMRKSAYQSAPSVRAKIPRFYDYAGAYSVIVVVEMIVWCTFRKSSTSPHVLFLRPGIDAAAIRSLPLPDGTRDDFAAHVSRSAIAYSTAFESKAPRLHPTGGAAADTYLRSRLRVLSQGPGALGLNTIKQQLTDPRSLQICASLRSGSPQRAAENRGALALEYAEKLGPGRYHDGLPVALASTRPRTTGSIVLPISALPREFSTPSNRTSYLSRP
jgi:hypothetical protein